MEEKYSTDPASFAPSSLRLPHSRGVLSRALGAHLELSAEFFQPVFGTALTALLQDSSGGVRRAAGRDVARVLALFDGSDQPHILREMILTRLSLEVPLPPDGAPGPATSAAWEGNPGTGGGEGGSIGDGDGGNSARDGSGGAGGAGMSAAARARNAEAAARERAAGDGYEEEGGGTDDDRMDDDGGDKARGGGGGNGGGAGHAGGPHEILNSGAAAAASAAACVEETAVLALGHLAAACPAVEARCVFLLVAHAAASRSRAAGGGGGSGGAQQSQQQARGGREKNKSESRPRCDLTPLVADVLTHLGAGLGYPSRRLLVARHARAVGALWIRAGLPVQCLLDVPELTAPVSSFAAAAAAEAMPSNNQHAAAAAAASTVSAGETASAQETVRKSSAKWWAPALLPPAVLAGNGGAAPQSASSLEAWNKLSRPNISYLPCVMHVVFYTTLHIYT